MQIETTTCPTCLRILYPCEGVKCEKATCLNFVDLDARDEEYEAELLKLKHEDDATKD